MFVWLTALAVLLLIALSAFFSASETALTASSRARLMHLEKSGDRRARTVLKLLEAKERLIGTLLLGNNAVNILSSALATAVLIRLFGDAGIAYATIVMTLLVLIFAEVLPKTWAIVMPERVATTTAPLVGIAVKVFTPLVAAIQFIVNAILRLFGVDASAATDIPAREEIRGAVDILHAEGGVKADERYRLGGLLDLSELEVSDVMVHRTAMRTINADDPPARIVDEVLASPFTRLPLWRDEPDNIVGVVHAKDLLRAVTTSGKAITEIDVLAVAAEPWFVPDTTTLQAQLDAFLRRRAHVALVVDEYGEVQGLVTLEDILEEIVGNIDDEHDVAIQGVRPQPDGTVLIDGAVPIRDLNRALHWTLPDAEATTIAGLVIHEARTIPDQGQQFTFHGYRFKVLRKQRNRIVQLRVAPVQEASQQQA